MRTMMSALPHLGVLALLLGSGAPRTSDLTLQQRVEAQRGLARK